MAKRKNPHAVALGRKGGKAKSAAKTAAVKLNARLPRRKAPRCGVTLSYAPEVLCARPLHHKGYHRRKATAARKGKG